MNRFSLVPIYCISTTHTHIFHHKNPPIMVEFSTLTVEISTMTVEFWVRETVGRSYFLVFGVTDVRYTQKLIICVTDVRYIKYITHPGWDYQRTFSTVRIPTFLICVWLTQLKNFGTLPLKLFNGPKVMPEYNQTTPSPKNGVKTTQKGTFTLLCDEGDSTSSESSFGSRSSDGSEYSVSSSIRYQWMYTPPSDPRIKPMRRFRCRKRLRFSPPSPPTSPNLSCLYSPGGQHKRFRGLRYIDEIERYYKCWFHNKYNTHFIIHHIVSPFNLKSHSC